MMMRRVVVVPGPAYRPPAYRPPSLHLGDHALGQTEVKFNWGNLGQTILFGSIGAGALYGAGLLPDPLKTVAMVGGVGLIGYAAYSFIGASPKQENEVRPGQGAPIPTPQEFSRISGQFLQPRSGSTQGFNWFSDTYPVKVLVSNPNPNPVTVTLQLVARESPKAFFVIPLGTYENYTPEGGTITTVVPGNQNVTLDFNPAIKMSRWLAGGGRQEMELTLRKVRLGGESADLDHVAFTLNG